jgi:intein-encoded DNA endonuclease-like protein
MVRHVRTVKKKARPKNSPKLHLHINSQKLSNTKTYFKFPRVYQDTDKKIVVYFVKNLQLRKEKSMFVIRLRDQEATGKLKVKHTFTNISYSLHNVSHEDTRYCCEYHITHVALK